MKTGNIGSWLDDDSGSLWIIQSTIKDGTYIQIQNLDTGENQTIHNRDFWLLLDSL